jgi:hypothetical protein
MPYPNCPGCRLTVYLPPAQAGLDKYPRCAARLGSVRSIFPSRRARQNLLQGSGVASLRGDPSREAAAQSATRSARAASMAASQVSAIRLAARRSSVRIRSAVATVSGSAARSAIRRRSS